MADINEILQLPTEQQVAIMEAIQENLEDSAGGTIELDNEKVEFLKKRIEQIDSEQPKMYQWNEVKQALAKKWNTQ